jgi:spermidine synthase
MLLALCAIFLLSGASALVFETLWFYQAGLAFGNSVWASSLVMAGFMGGLAVGNALAARVGDRLAGPVRVYAVLEVLIAVTGVGLVMLLPQLTALLAPLLGVLHDAPWLLNPLRLVFAFALLLVPASAMGMTLPILTRALTRADDGFGHVLGRLYAWNTAGAVLGTLLAETILIGALGIRSTAYAAGALNLVAAAAAAFIATRMGPSEPATKRLVASNPASAWPWLTAAFLSGFSLLALEVVWFRFLSLFVHTSTEAFAFMLAIVLAGIASGGAVASAWLRRKHEAHAHTATVIFGAGVLCVATYAAVPWVISTMAVRPLRSAAEILRLGIPLMLPVSLLSGAIFTLLGSSLRAHLPTVVTTAGVLTLANTLGAALGAFVGGFVLLPQLGMERSFFALALLYMATGALLLLRAEGGRRLALIAGAAALASLVLFPFGSMESRHVRRTLAPYGSPPAEQVSMREGIVETILYIEDRVMGRPHHYRMVTNSFSMSGTPVVGRRYMKLYVYWPVAINPELKSALLISFGVGSTAKALVDTPQLESIDIVDISPEIVEMSGIVFPSEAEHPLHDPRVRLHIEDGRYFLESTDQRFDLITGEPPPPGIAGVASLYTREYFELVRERLSDGGIATYWLPLAVLTDQSALGITGAFCEAFEDCSLWHGMGPDLMLVGTRGTLKQPSSAAFSRQWQDPNVVDELVSLGFEFPEQMGALFIGDADYLRQLSRDVPPLTDDQPKRITAPASSAENQRAVFGGWFDTEAARKRFHSSPLIQRLWPPELTKGADEHFSTQMLNDAIGRQLSFDWAQRFSALDLVLSNSRLTSLPGWLLSSDVDMQRIAADIPSGDPAEAEAQYHLGVRSLANRDYAAAAAHMADSARSPALYHRATAIRIFALGMGGDHEAAQRIAAAEYERMGSGGPLVAYWTWLRERFGIDPQRIPTP